MDGSYYLLEIVRTETFLPHAFEPARTHARFVSEIPVVTAIFLGVSDLHWLARLLSLGLFALPLALYTIALIRAGDDAVLLAAAIASVAAVFMTTSFNIVGEWNTAYAAAILAAVWLASAERLRRADGVVLVAIAALSVRSYEVYIYLGPLLAAMTLWRVRRTPSRSVLATGSYLAAAVLFLAGMAVAVESVVVYDDQKYLAATLSQARDFWKNLQFDLVLVAALVVLLWAFVRPRDLATARPYYWAGISLILLALSPLLAFFTVAVEPPFSFSQTVARTAGGFVVAFIVVFIWSWKSGLGTRLQALAALRVPEASRRFLAFACLMVIAMLPWSVLIGHIYSLYLGEMRATIRAQSGVIAFEDTRLATRPRLLQGESWSFPSNSLVMRTKPADGVIAPPEASTGPLPFALSAPPDLGRFAWRD